MSEQDKFAGSSLGKTIFILAGAALLTGGISIINHILANIEGGIVYLFILFLPAPMVVFGICAIYEGLRTDKPTKSSNVITENLSTVEAENVSNNTNIPNIGNQETNEQETNTFQSQGNDDVGSHLATLFFVFGFVVLLMVLIGITIIDINNGVTNVCPRHSPCYKVYLSDSPTQFYINLTLGRAAVLIFTVLFGIFAFKRLKE